MNRLPKVLQNEIWEYVRGDRAYWRQRHQELVTDRMNFVIEKSEVNSSPNCKKHETLILYAKRLPTISCQWWIREIPGFMKYQHKTHGQLFADTHEEYGQKLVDWRSYRVALNARSRSFTNFNPE